MAAGHDATADAAATMLRAGGNAFDAVIAAGFASSVCEPGFTSLAGGGYLLARSVEGHRDGLDPDGDDDRSHGDDDRSRGGDGDSGVGHTGTDRLYDFFVDTPGRGGPDAVVAPVFDEVAVSFGAARQLFHCGFGSVAVPGVLAGYLHVHRRLGRLPLADVVAPAIALATGGVEVSPTQAHAFGLLEPIFARTAASRAIFFPDGRLLTTGDLLHNPDLGAYLRRLADDPADTFYRGEQAAALAAQAHRAGGLVTEEDLHAYRVIERAPLRFGYRGRSLLTNPPPTFGGCLLALALQRYERQGPPAPLGSPERTEAMRAVMAGIDADRRDGHPEVLAALAGRLVGHGHPGAGDGNGANPGDRPDSDPTAGPVATRGTTHVTVADGEGNVAAMTTSNGECSGDVIEGTGICANNMLGEDDLHPGGFHAAPPGLRVGSMMSPTFVLGDRGEVRLALGSGGSKRIRSAIFQVVTAVVDHAQPLADAVAAPRIHWDTDHTEAEPGLGTAVLEHLAAAAPVNGWPAPSMYFGGVHAVIPQGPGTGGGAGAGDHRRGGAVRVVP